MSGPCIVILTPGFPASETDTTCLPPVQQFCLCVREQFPQLRIVVVATQYPFRRGVYTWHGIQVYAAGGANRRKTLRLITWVRTWSILNSVWKQHHPASVLSLWLGETALLGKWLAKRRRLRHIIWLQGQDAKKDNRYVRRVNPSPASLVSISPFNAAELLRNHNLRAGAVITNGVNTAVFPPFNNGPRNIDVFGAGALIPLKNYELFLHAIYELKKLYPAVLAVLAGDGPEARQLAELVTKLGLRQNVKLVGSVPHSQVLDLMSRSRIFLHPSKYEGHSTVLLEALYSGCATVSFQPVAEGTTDNFYPVENVSQLHVVMKNIYPATNAKRVLVSDMRNTARQMISLLLDPAEKDASG